ncbi:MAG: hypothetical protein ACSHW7_14990 [Patiriisocius sp.]|uniref:hypothetical protein n=1 Tax=Patiriisocius sp. TaxID=2822396 RepID=UPI003EF6E2D7
MSFLYFDAGTGMMIVQAIAAVFAGILLFSKGVLYKIKSFFGMNKYDDDTYDSIDVDENEDEEDDKK